MTAIRQKLLFLCLISLPLTSTVGLPDDPYVPTEKFWINCGASGEALGENDVTWTGDEGSAYGTFAGNSYVGKPLNQSVRGQGIPFLSARIFTSEFTYSFPVIRGRKFVRIYFYPSTYSTTGGGGGSYRSDDAVFGVNLGNFTILRNFTASAYVNLEENKDVVQFEFSLNVSSSDNLNLTFSPANSSSHAFVNGISIVSIPDIFRRPNLPSLVRPGVIRPYPIDPDKAFQTLQRLNVGGSFINPNQDSGLFRSWSVEHVSSINGRPHPKDANITIKYPSNYPTYIAPEEVYATSKTMRTDKDLNLNFNLTWTVDVDGGFFYLIRLHFCEIDSHISKQNMRVFCIYINKMVARNETDVIVLAGGLGIPTHLDFVVVTPQGPRQKISVELHPQTETKPYYYQSILNGLEIFKVSDVNNNLAGPNPERPNLNTPPPSPPFSKPNTKKYSAAIIGGAIGAFLLLCVILILVYRKRICGRCLIPAPTPEIETKLLPTNICRHFTLAEMKAATNDFDEKLVIGKGGFGKVYRGTVRDEEDRSVTVAIKCCGTPSQQGDTAFMKEIEMLSQLRHRNLVSLVGYCNDSGNLILVYEYMVNGTLKDHLNYNHDTKTKNNLLSWKQRLNICIGAARGLHHLHTGAKDSIIHRDVKTANILLDDNWAAKVSDFGISKFVSDPHMSISLKGTPVYIDPEYVRTHLLSDKCDVYSFGVVLFEVICCRRAFLPDAPVEEEKCLPSWVVHCKKNGKLKDIVDENLKKEIKPKCLNKYIELAEMCTDKRGVHRPPMGDVVRGLELAKEFQEYNHIDSFDDDGGVGDVTGSDKPQGKERGKEYGYDLPSDQSKSNILTLTNNDITTTSSTYSQVGDFSEIIDPKER